MKFFKSLISLTVVGLFTLPVFAMDTKQYEAASNSTEITAKVKDIDYKTRKITLSSEGKTESFVAGDEIKNLDQIKKGDTVTLDYKESLVFNLNKGGKATAPVETESGQRNKPGSKPGAEAAREVTATVMITKIDKKAPSVTFKDAEGETQTFKVKHPERLEGVKVGDSVTITYSQAMAVKVEKESTL